MALPRLSIFAASLCFVWTTAQAQPSPYVAWIKSQAEQAHVFAVASEPGMADTTILLKDLVPALGTSGYGAYGVSMGPWMAANLEDIAERGGDELERFLADPQNARQMQVLNDKESIALIRSIQKHWGRWPRNLWGVDQEFLTSAPFLLERLSMFAPDEAAKAVILSYRDVARTQNYYLATAENRVFDHLHSLFPEEAEEPHALINEMALSKYIYGPFLDDNARIKKAHERREALLFENFLRYTRDNAPKAIPKVLVELPPAHLHGEKTPLGVPSFGNSLRKYVKAKGQKLFSLAVICGPNGYRRLVEGGIKECGPGFRKKYAELMPLVDGRDKPVLLMSAALQGQSIAVQRLKTGFDAVLIFPQARASTPAIEVDAAMVP
ncbi:MAG: hypothetical protein PVF65_10800 [Sphingomonadales bacterium]|jgi:hypothetical protein